MATKRRGPEPTGKTPVRTIRIDDDLWQQAKDRASAEGRTVGWVVRYALREYAAGRLLPDARVRQDKERGN